MDTVVQDLRYAARKLLRTPGFSIVATPTLALAIGATTAVYSIVDGVLLKPLPFRAPQQLVRLQSTGRDGKPFPLSPADYLDFAGNPNIIGQSIMLDERPTTIIGVAPSRAMYPQASDVFTPRIYQPSADPSARGAHQFFAVARLKDGVTIARAREEVRTIAKRLAERFPNMDSEFGVDVVPL